MALHGYQENRYANYAYNSGFCLFRGIIAYSTLVVPVPKAKLSMLL